jgi:hypothetical protein
MVASATLLAMPATADDLSDEIAMGTKAMAAHPPAFDPQFLADAKGPLNDPFVQKVIGCALGTDSPVDVNSVLGTYQAIKIKTVAEWQTLVNASSGAMGTRAAAVTMTGDDHQKFLTMGAMTLACREWDGKSDGQDLLNKKKEELLAIDPTMGGAPHNTIWLNPTFAARLDNHGQNKLAAHEGIHAVLFANAYGGTHHQVTGTLGWYDGNESMWTPWHGPIGITPQEDSKRVTCGVPRTVDWGPMCTALKNGTATTGGFPDSPATGGKTCGLTMGMSTKGATGTAVAADPGATAASGTKVEPTSGMEYMTQHAGSSVSNAASDLVNEVKSDANDGGE